MFKLSYSASKFTAVVDHEYESIKEALYAAYDFAWRYNARIFIFKHGVPFMDVGIY